MLNVNHSFLSDPNSDESTVILGPEELGQNLNFNESDENLVEDPGSKRPLETSDSSQKKPEKTFQNRTYSTQFRYADAK